MSKSKAEPAPQSVRNGALIALQRQSHVYGGTVDPVTVQERRAANKTARASRRTNRRAGR